MISTLSYSVEEHHFCWLRPVDRISVPIHRNLPRRCSIASYDCLGGWAATAFTSSELSTWRLRELSPRWHGTPCLGSSSRSPSTT